MLINLFTSDTTNGALFALINRLKENDKMGERHFVVVPDRFSLSVEQEIFDVMGSDGAANIDVLSFSRLAKMVLKKSPRKFLSEQGALLLFKKTINKQINNLIHYKRAVKSASFASEMFNAVGSFKTSGIEASQIIDALPTLYKSTKAKAQDIATLLEAYESELLDYLDAISLMQALKEEIKKSTDLKSAHVYIGGFFRFSTPEYKVIEELIKTCSSVNIALSTTNKGKNAEIYPKSALERLKEIAKELKIKEREQYLQDNLVKEPFKSLNRNLFTYQGSAKNKDSAISLYLDNTIYDEFNGIAKEINLLVKTKGFRYKDFAIVSSYEGYENVVSSVLQKNNIPIFSDTKYKLSDTYLAKYLINLLEVQAYNFRQDKVINLINSPLFGLEINDRWAYENHVLKFGINYNSFFKTIYTGLETEEKLELIRNKVVSDVCELKGFKKNKHFLTFLKAKIEGESLKEQFEKTLEGIKEEEFLLLSNTQSLDTITELLDEFGAIMGEESTTAKEFLDVFKSLIEAHEISLIPRFIDSVFLGNLTESRLNNIKVLFIAGANLGMLPSSGGQRAIFSELDYEILKSAGLSVYPTLTDLMKEEEFLILDLITKPTHKLYIGGARSLPNGTELKPSPIIKEICQFFETTVTNFREKRKDKREEKAKDSYQIADINHHKTQHNLSVVSRQSSVDFPASYYQQQNKNEDFYFVATEDNKSNISITQIQNFFECPYKFHLNYGLRLKEKEIMGIKPLDNGLIIHRAFELYSKSILGRVKKLSDSELLKRAENAIDTAISEYFKNHYHQDPVMENQKIGLKKEFIRASKAITKQMKKSEYQPKFVEKWFGSSSSFPAVEIETENKIYAIRGKMDRIDIKVESREEIKEKAEDSYQIADINHHNLSIVNRQSLVDCEANFQSAVVIDYKTGGKESGLSEIYQKIYNGTKIQLPLYLLAIERAGLNVAGAFNVFVKDSYGKDGVDYKAYGLANEKYIEENDYDIGYPKGKIDEEFMNAVLKYTIKIITAGLKEIEKGNTPKNPIKECGGCIYKAICLNDGEERAREEAKISAEIFSLQNDK